MRIIYFLVFAMIPGVSVEAGTYRALLVGINEYSYVSSLEYCVNDATDMRAAFLTDSIRWQSGNITTLTDASATKAAVQAQLAALASASVSGDVVVYFHSSHGGQISGTDTYLCTYDANFTDAEIATSLSAFATGVSVIVIADACYAGGLFLKPGESPPRWNLAANTMKHVQARRKEKAFAEKMASIGWMTACRYDELAEEDGALENGVFAYYLLEGFTFGDANADSQYTFLELFNYADPLATAFNPGQDAQSYNETLLGAVIAKGLSLGTLEFSAANFTVSENDSTATITVTRTGSTVGVLTVDYTTSDGTATAGFDYTARSGTLTFPAGSGNSQSFTIPILDDADMETDETVALILSNNFGGALGAQSTSTLTIEDNDGPGTFAFSSATYSVFEGQGYATITVARTKGLVGAASVDYATSDGTAVAGADYTSASGALTFGNGVSSATFTVPLINNTAMNADKTVNLALANPAAVRGTAYLGSPLTAQLTILDDESRASESSCRAARNTDGTSISFILPFLLIFMIVARKRIQESA